MARTHLSTQGPARRLGQHKARLAQRLPDPTETLRGSLVRSLLRCGKPSCRCHAPGAKGHGPYVYLHLTLGTGRTKTFYVGPHLVPLVRRWTKNYRRLKKGLEEITRVNVKLVQASRKQDGR